jgi:hypothetical protein
MFCFIDSTSTSTSTSTGAIPTTTGPADGTKACGRGQAKCPSGYVCREKSPGRIADYMFCFIDSNASSPTPTPTTLPPNAEGKVCGGFAGVECPSGYTCEIEEVVDGAVVNDAQGICKIDEALTA